MTTDYTTVPLGIWVCKIGEAPVLQEQGLDFPMRQAVASAYKHITGRDNDFIFSGWRGELTEQERAVVDNRLPVEDEVDESVKRGRLKRLESDSNFLAALRAAGVDNWEGYEHAVRDFNGEEED